MQLKYKYMKSLIASLLISFLCISCGDGIDNFRMVNPFKVEVQVLDLDGNALSGINISICSNIIYKKRIAKTASTNNTKSSTTIRFSLLQQCYVDLSPYDLNGLKI